MEKRTHEGIYLPCENCKIGERNRAAKAGISNFTQWLADDSASGFVTGTVISVDGGFSAYSVINITILMNNIPWDSDGTGV